MRINEKEIDRLMRAYASQQLLDRREELNALVPPGTDRAVQGAFSKMQAMVDAGAFAIPAAGGRALHAARAAKTAAAGLTAAKAVKAAALTLAAASVIGAGSYAAIPAVRSAVNEAVGIHETAKEKRPGDYVLPSPGAGYTVTDEAFTENLAARWYTDGDKQIMAQAAYTLPDGIDPDGTPIQIDTLWGTYRKQENTEQIVLFEGSVSILIRAFNLEADEITEYAHAIVRANDGGTK